MARMRWLVLATLILPAFQVRADPGGRPNERSGKTRPEKESARKGADNWRTLWIGGYRADIGGVEESERWRREKAQAHRDEKARRDRAAHERLAREQERRSDVNAKLEREKRAGEERRAKEKAKQESKRAKGKPEAARK